MGSFLSNPGESFADEFQAPCGTNNHCLVVIRLGCLSMELRDRRNVPTNCRILQPSQQHRGSVYPLVVVKNGIGRQPCVWPRQCNIDSEECKRGIAPKQCGVVDQFAGGLGGLNIASRQGTLADFHQHGGILSGRVNIGGHGSQSRPLHPTELRSGQPTTQIRRLGGINQVAKRVQIDKLELLAGAKSRPISE